MGIFNSKKKNYYLQINELLEEKNFKNNNNFNNFILEDEFFLLDEYLNYISIISDYEKAEKFINKLENIYTKKKYLISFKKLFNLDDEWYEYYKENADRDGRVFNTEGRLGVNKKKTNDIMICKKLCIPRNNNSLLESINFSQKINIVLNQN